MSISNFGLINSLNEMGKERMYWGKYRNRLFSELATHNPLYVRWVKRRYSHFNDIPKIAKYQFTKFSQFAYYLFLLQWGHRLEATKFSTINICEQKEKVNQEMKRYIEENGLRYNN